jgi:NAD(P)H-hydrate epimerase
VNTNGNSGLSKGGSGDALTGMILSFLAQGYLPNEAAQLAVFLHGLAADLTQDSQSNESMLISDVIENIGKSFKTIGNI